MFQTVPQGDALPLSRGVCSVGGWCCSLAFVFPRVRRATTAVPCGRECLSPYTFDEPTLRPSDKKSGRSVAVIAKRRRGSNPSSIHKPVVIITTTQHMQRVHWHDGTTLATHAQRKIWCCSSRGRRYRVRTTAAAAVQRHVAAADFMAGGAMSLREI